MSNSDEETDRKLAAWLKKILPAVEKELKEGLTQVYDTDSRSSSHVLSVGSFQEIDVKSHFVDCDEKQITATATWLSVTMQSNPVLAISCSTKSSINEQKNAFLIIFEPQRSKIDGNIYWQEVSCIPVKDTIDFLTTNPQNRDMFAGASTSGDLYIWNYNKSSTAASNSKVDEIFSKASEDSIVGMSFVTDNCLLTCSSEGNLIIYKINSKQNCSIDKTFKINASKMKESSVTALASITGSNDFVVGLLNGKLFLCSSNLSHGSTDPIVRELNPHKFAVKHIKHCQVSNKNYIASCDTSCAIFIHEIDEEFEKSSLKLVITLPLPIKNSLSITSNMEYILCPLTNGGLEIFNTMTNTRRTLEGSHTGSGNISELSKNE